VKKYGKSSEQLYNELGDIRKGEETPSDVKRILNSILPKVNALNLTKTYIYIFTPSIR
jgi:hypothetical protein